MKNLKTVALLVLLFISSVNANADKYYFEQISLHEGLSQSTVKAIFRDHIGMLWIGTREGLNRYDGQSIRTYLNDPKNPNSLPHNNIFFIADNGKTWQSAREEQLTDPSCNAGLIAIKYRGKNYLIFSNANSRNKRENLTIRISDDDGKTWSAGFPIYSGGSAYSALTITKDGNLGIFFEKDNYTKNAFVSVPLKKLLKK